MRSTLSTTILLVPVALTGRSTASTARTSRGSTSGTGPSGAPRTPRPWPWPGRPPRASARSPWASAGTWAGTPSTARGPARRPPSTWPCRTPRPSSRASPRGPRAATTSGTTGTARRPSGSASTPSPRATAPRPRTWPRAACGSPSARGSPWRTRLPAPRRRGTRRRPSTAPRCSTGRSRWAGAWTSAGCPSSTRTRATLARPRWAWWTRAPRRWSCPRAPRAATTSGTPRTSRPRSGSTPARWPGAMALKPPTARKTGCGCRSA
mmetsp:Transcript_45617/g.145567  ORF Transcript_45617/g.145567 Transcript_45617/m.145567 type:complete len:265 (-) Transcript_45617:335-1129(-)